MPPQPVDLSNTPRASHKAILGAQCEHKEGLRTLYRAFEIFRGCLLPSASGDYTSPLAFLAARRFVGSRDGHCSKGVWDVKVRASIKRICEGCKIVRRKGRAYVICSSNPRHKQRQG